MIVYTNQRFAEIMGYEPGELDGRPVADINWEDEPGDAERVAERIAADIERFGEAWCEQRNRRKDGEPHLVRGARRGVRPSRPRAGLGVGASRT